MSVKSAMNTRFSNKPSVRVATVPRSMRPTVESIEKTGRRISAQIRSNNAMRIRSLNNAAKRSVN